MGSLVKAYYQMNHNSIPFHHYSYRPSNLQYPISLFAITSPSSDPSSSLPPPHKHPPPLFGGGGGGHFIIPTIAVAASAWFFFRLHQYPPILTAPLDLHLDLLEEGAVKELPLESKPRYVQALHFYKIQPGTVFKLLDVFDSDSYDSLKARIRLSAEWLETARRELEEVVERDPGRVMEYSQVVDELMEILRDMEVYIDKCQKDNVKGYLRSCNRLLARVRRMEAQILNVLKDFHQGGGGGGHTF